MAVPTKLAGRSYKGAKRGAKATEAERETIYGHMSTDSAVWEFVNACEQWKKDNSRTFVPQSSIFQIILKLGYRKLGNVYKICDSCGSFFTPREGETPGGWKRRKYCSKKCAGLAKVPDDRRQKVCENCNEKFYFQGNCSAAQWTDRKFCSNSCASAYTHRKYEWTDEDKQLIVDEFPIKGSSIPGLIDKGYPRSIIKATARRMGIKYIPGQSHVAWKDTESKICEGCGVKVYPGEKESRKSWNARRYCTHECACANNKKVIFTDEELAILRRDYAVKGSKTDLPGKTPCQVQRQANKMGLTFDKSSGQLTTKIFAVRSKKGKPLDLRIPKVLPIKLNDLPTPKAAKTKEIKWWETASKVCPVCGKTFYPKGTYRRDRKKWENEKNTCSRACTWRICKDGDIWTQEEIDTVAVHYPLIGSRVLSMIINKDQAKLTLWVNTHKIRMRQHKGGKKNIFTPYEAILIAWFYPVIGKEVVKYLNNKTDRQVYSWANRNGISANSTAPEPCDSIIMSLFRLTQSENCGRLLVDNC